jgi:hypothetical protein
MTLCASCASCAPTSMLAHLAQRRASARQLCGGYGGLARARSWRTPPLARARNQIPALDSWRTHKATGGPQ